MSIFDFFFGRKQNENNSRRSVKLNRRAVRTRNLAMEPLETRDLLSVTTGLIDDSAYAELRAQYPEFNLPEEQSTLNVMVVDLDEGATALKLADLKSAISTAKSSSQSDLILVKTTNSANTITYSSSSDEITISAGGSVTIIGWGTKKLTLDANQMCRVMSINNGTNTYLGNMTIKSGKLTVSAMSATYAYGGGIYSTSTLTLTNCIISSNTAYSHASPNSSSINRANAYGGGIYTTGVLTLTNCTISGNSSSAISSSSYAYGGGIYSTNALSLTNCIISGNSASSSYPSTSYSSSYSYSYGGGICFWNDSFNGQLLLTNCTVLNNRVSSVSSSYFPYSAGAGIYTITGSWTLTNCTISKNTISSKSSTSYGGGICSDKATITIYNSIITQNSSSDIYKKNGSINAYNTLSSYTSWTNGSNNITYDSSKPLFVSTSDYHLADNSQAINKGNNSYAVDSSGQPLKTDLTGIPRIIGGNVDIGAYEYDSRTTLPVPQVALFIKYSTQVSGVKIYPVENATGYKIEYSLNEDFSDSVIIDAQVGENVLMAFQKPLTYYWRIKTVGDNLDYFDSDFSETHSCTIEVPVRDILLSTETPEVGTIITATLNPSGATAIYQWYSGETLIDDATDSSFTVTKDQIGQTITCVVTGIEGYNNTVSATTEVVPAIALNTPVLSAVNSINTVAIVTWSEVDNADGYTFEYQLDGSDNWITTTGLLGTTEAFVGNIGSTYNVRVKANGSGDYSDSDFSDIVSITLTIPPTPLTSLALSSIAPEVGTEIIASLIPTDATADYQWYSGETLIEGATGSTFIVTEDQIGQTITCVATGTGDYTGTVSMTTAVVPVPVTALDAPADVALSVYNATVTASWSAVENASSYTLEYKPVDAENWTALPGLEDTTASFVGVSGTMYNVRVKAVGTGDYSDSTYAEINTDKPTGPDVAINANKVTVSWVDDSPAADSVRYRVAGTTTWTTKKLKAGITSLTFNAAIGKNYDIEVLLDQQENNVLQGSAIVLDQPRLTSIRNELKDDTFQVNVTNYAAKNLAANVKQAIVSVNGVMTTLKIADQQGETALANGGKVSFSNGLFTFSEMNSNTSYKVTISFSDGHSVSKTSSALTVKTLKAPYLPPVIVSANAVSDTSITVTWDTAYGKNSTTPAQKYTVQYSTDGNKWTNATTGATGNTYTIQRLKGGMEYQVRVLATKDTAFEASAPSGVLSAQTLTLPKTVLDKASVKDDTFKLNVTNYVTSNLVNAPTLNVKSDKFGEAAIAIQNGSGSATFENGMVAAFENGAVTFTNVPSNTQQRIQVNFSDGVCTTAWTAALTVKTTIAPYNKPVITNATAVSSTTVLVEWDAVTGKNSTVLAPSYTVQYTTDGTRWINANTRVVGTSFTIPNLKPNTSYRVAVIANKDARFNASQPSESWEVRTL